MAVIGKIREKSGLVMIIIGVGMLAFLLPTEGIQNLFGGIDNNLGVIGGTEITGQDFDRRLDVSISQWENQNNSSASSEVRESIKEQVWTELIREIVLESQYKELGVGVSPEELFDMVQGNDPHPQVKQAFTDPNTGVFNPTQVLQFLKGLENMPASNRTQWLLFEDGIEKERIASKYNNLLTKGLYATSSMVKRVYKEQNEKRNIKFVAKRYVSVNDTTITVTDEELKAYYEEHKNEYKQDASREIEFVKFEVLPSKSDISKTRGLIEEAAEEFKICEHDSSFVVYNSDNSDIPLDEAYYGKDAMPLSLDSNFFYAEIGTTTAVYEEDGSFKVTKLSKTKMVPDSVKARHILLKTTQQASDTLLEARLEKMKLDIENGADFATLAKDSSEDVASALEGGDLGWFSEGAMVAEFNDACFNGKVGDVLIVQSQFGFHLIEITKQAAKVKKVQLANLIRTMTPSKATFDEVFSQASMFFSKYNTSELYAKATEGDKHNKYVATEVKVADKNIPGMENVRDLVRWSFKNDRGTVSEPMRFENTFIVAHLAEVREEGIATMEQVEIQIELGAKKKKKAEMFIAEMQGTSSLEALANKIEVEVESAPNVNFAAYAIPGMGQELRINGMASTLKEGEMSIPIEGQTGVFVIQIESLIPAPETEDYTAIKTQLNQSNSAVTGQLLEALKDKFGVVDKRYKFY